MTTKRIAWMLLVVTLGFSAVFFLPKSVGQPFGVSLALLPKIGDWYGKDEEILAEERSTLGKGTDFARKRYRTDYATDPSGRGVTYGLLVSMVLSGPDMSTSIHRPERCLDAQGWTVLESDDVEIDLEGKGRFSVTRLYNRMTKRAPDGTTHTFDAYTYYWFVGEHEIESTHWGRWYTDNKDRLFRGVNQRWAFITVTGVIPTQNDPAKSEAAKKWTDETVRSFIAQLAPTIHTGNLSYH